MADVLWREKYFEAMLEFNREELPARIAAAEKAIRQRIEEVGRGSENTEEELWELSDALRGLRVLAQAECRAPHSSKLDRRRQEAS